MSDMITVADPGYSWTPWIFAGGVVALVAISALVCLVVSRLASTWRTAEGWFSAFKVIGIIALSLIGAGAGASAIISASIYDSTVKTAKAEAMRDLGYHEVEYDRGQSILFNAYRDGRYVKGVAVEVVPLTWQVIELDIPDTSR